MSDITWTTAGITPPATSLTVDNTTQLQGNGDLFTTTDTDGVIAPANNTSNGGAWSITLDFTTQGGAIELEDFELTYLHFSGAGISQNALRDANYTFEIRDSTGTALPGSSSTVNTEDINTAVNGPQTISFNLTGVTLAANTDYTLFVEAADADGPAGNNTGFDAFSLNNNAGTAPPESIRITNFTYDAAANSVTLAWDSEPGDTFTIRFSSDLNTWLGDLNDGEPADPDGTTTTQTFDLNITEVASSPRVYFQVQRNPVAVP